MKISINRPISCNTCALCREIAKAIHEGPDFVQRVSKKINVSSDIYNWFYNNAVNNGISHLAETEWAIYGFSIAHYLHGGEVEVPDMLFSGAADEKKYERFKLHWMLDHGYTLKDLIIALNEYQQDCKDNTSIEKIFKTWEMDCGFGSEIWPCFDEFMECEE